MKKQTKTSAAGSRGGCAPWCSPKHHRFCGSPVCCPHLHTNRPAATSSKGGKR